jgi:hypothetical protein
VKYKSDYAVVEAVQFHNSTTGVKEIIKAVGSGWRRADLDNPDAGVTLFNGKTIMPGQWLVIISKQTVMIMNEADFCTQFEQVEAHES